MTLENIEDRVKELIEELGRLNQPNLRKLASKHKIKGYNLKRKHELVVEVAAAIAADEIDHAPPPDNPTPPPAPEVEDPELAPGYFSRQDVVDRVTPERLDPNSEAGKVYLRWDPETLLIRALKDGRLVSQDMVQSCENIPPGCNYDKLAGYLRQRCINAGMEVADDWTWAHEKLRDHSRVDKFTALEPAVYRPMRVIYEDADLQEDWDE